MAFPDVPPKRRCDRRLVVLAHVKRGSGAGRAAALALVVAAAAMVPLVLAPQARAVTPTLIMGRNRVGEFQGVPGGQFIAWQENSRRSPRHYDVFARRLGGGGAFKVNAAGTNGANGGIDGNVLLYQEFGKGKSDLKLFDLADRSRSSPPRGVNTAQWEYWPSMSGDHLLFGRLYKSGLRRIILFDVSSRDATSLDKVKGARRFLAPGQVNGDYAVWSKCTSKRRCNVVLYRISDGTKTKIPNSGGRDHAPSVTPDGVVYFARSGGACGSGTKILRLLPGGPPTILWRLPSGDDVGTTRAFLDPGGETTVFYDHFACGLATESDVWEIVEEPPIQLSVTVQGAGDVTSTPAGINCGSDCSETYDVVTGVSLTATPSGSAVFAGWSGACTGTSTTCTLTMNGPKLVTASFSNKPVLTVTKAGGGGGTVTSSPAGIDCGTNCSQPYDAGTMVTLTATPNLTSSFAGWSGGGCTGTGSCVVTMDASKSVTATFDAKPVLSVSKTGDGAGAGTVTSSPGGIDCGSDCDETYDAGTDVTLTAVADPPTAFVQWDGACSGILVPVCTLTMDASKAVSADFDDPTTP
jgi:Divergent InlB B-repeat domain/WD40-like Beta Propeller Repeat